VAEVHAAMAPVGETDGFAEVVDHRHADSSG
jgi:hypothetical protein